MDDLACFNPGDSSRVQIGGCLGTDFDFDGVAYPLVWPGTSRNPQQDFRLHTAPVLFIRPVFQPGGHRPDDAQN